MDDKVDIIPRKGVFTMVINLLNGYIIFEKQIPTDMDPKIFHFNTNFHLLFAWRSHSCELLGITGDRNK